MAYDFEKDVSAKSFEMKLDNETIMTAFFTTDEEADGTLPELSDGVYGGIGFGTMGADWEPLGGGGGDLGLASVTLKNTLSSTKSFFVALAIDEEGMSGSGGQSAIPANENASMTVILYKGHCIMMGDASYTFEVESGNAELVGGMVDITGDCVVKIVNI